MRQPIISEISRRCKLNIFKHHLPSGSSVLEVGSGSGWFSKKLEEGGYRVTTLDTQTPADIVGDINTWERLNIEPHSFDAVVALEIIEHADCLDALRSVCKIGGLIFLSSPHPQGDGFMKVLEFLHLTQKRTSAHSHLIDFNDIPMPALLRQRPMLIHQVAIFVNKPLEDYEE